MELSARLGQTAGWSGQRLSFFVVGESWVFRLENNEPLYILEESQARRYPEKLLCIQEKFHFWTQQHPSSDNQLHNNDDALLYAFVWP